MDNIKKRIAGVLQLNGFQTSKSIASSIGVSERTIRRHLDAMIKQKLLKVVAVPNPIIYGFEAWSKIGIKADPPYLHQIAASLVKHPAVYFAAYSMGRFDIIIAAHFTSILKLSHFVNSELASLKGLTSHETWILSSPRKYYRFLWPSPKSDQLNSKSVSHNRIESETKYILNAKDYEIISILRENTLSHPVEIKTKLGLAESTVRQQIKRLQDNNVFINEVVLNPKLLENETWATVDYD